MEFFGDMTFKIDCNVYRSRNTFIPAYWKKSLSNQFQRDIRTYGAKRRNTYVTAACGDGIIAL